MLPPDQPTSTVLAVHLQDLYLSERMIGRSKKSGHDLVTVGERGASEVRPSSSSVIAYSNMRVSRNWRPQQGSRNTDHRAETCGCVTHSLHNIGSRTA